jgi:hypothetical protein
MRPMHVVLGQEAWHASKRLRQKGLLLCQPYVLC